MNLIILIFLTILYYCNHSTDAFTLKGAVLPQVKMHGSKIEEVEIDTNGNFEIELEIKQPLVYEADRLPKKNYYLNFESKLKVEQPNPKLFTIDDPNLLLISGNMIDVQIHFMESRIETEVNRSVLSNSEMKKDEKRIITIRGNIVKLPDIDCSWKIKVELFKSDPRANSSQQLSAKSISEKFVNDTAIFEFKIKSDELRIKKPGFGGLFSKNDNKNNKFGPIHLMVTPVPIVKPREFQHTLTYPTLAAKSNDSDNSYRYNFGTIVYSESAVDKEEKKSMVQLYKAYLHEAKAKSMYNLAKSFVGNVDAYKLSLQMVRMRMVKDIEE
uniref:Uncharacterized protein n=1 Tax=Globodera rostochiensis TaxID=31243 RepID=A0A914IFG5_GLORO